MLKTWYFCWFFVLFTFLLIFISKIFFFFFAFYRWRVNAVFPIVLQITIHQSGILLWFPRDDERRKQWVSSINRKDFTPGSSAAVCVLHCDERFVVKEDKFPQKDGTIITVPRKKTCLNWRCISYIISKSTSLLVNYLLD